MEKRIIYVATIVFIIPLILIFLIMVFSSNEQKINFSYNEEYIELDSFIYDKVYFQDIKDLKLLTDNDLKIQKQGAGFQNNNFFSGEAIAESIGSCRAYIYLHKDNYIFVSSKINIIFNLETDTDTREMYEELKNIYQLRSID